MSWTELIPTRRTNASRLYRPPLVKGSTPDRDVTPTESERAGSDHGGSGVEEGEAQEEGESYIGSRSRETVTELEDTTPGRESWRSARGRD